MAIVTLLLDTFNADQTAAALTLVMLGVALLIANHPDRASDQWMWRPEIGRDQRIALQDRSTRFFGTDFSFEDLEERDVNQYDYKIAGDVETAKLVDRVVTEELQCQMPLFT